MEFKQNRPSRGKLLISEPALRDFYFGRSVVLLVEHTDGEGTIGLILNKPIHLKLNQVVKEFPDNEFPLFLGGPVHPERLSTFINWAKKSLEASRLSPAFTGEVR